MRFLYFFSLSCIAPIALANISIVGVDRLEQTTMEFQEGRDYFSYQVPIDVEDNATNRKIRIQSFFDYDCRVCINTQDILALYNQINPNTISLEEYPIATQQAHFSAQVYYTLKRMNHEDLSDLLLFETADVSRYLELAQYNNLLAWLAEQNVDIKLFSDIFKSNEIRQQIEQAIIATEKYGVFTYPFVVIDGKYVLTNSTLYNDDYTFAVLDFLVYKLVDEQQENKIGK